MNDCYLPILQEFMDPRDVALIRGIEISPRFKRDCIIWYFTNFGRYTVKSRYWLSSVLQTGEGDKYVGEPSTTVLKAQVCKLCCPAKIKHFIWQVVSGSVAVSSRLNQRGVNYDTICSRCEVAKETVIMFF